MPNKLGSQIWEVIQLHQGKEQAITGKEIGRLVSCTARHVRVAVENLRVNEGYPIASCNGTPAGYYIPSSAEEVEACIKMITHPMARMSLTVRSLNKTLGEFGKVC